MVGCVGFRGRKKRRREWDRDGGEMRRSPKTRSESTREAQHPESEEAGSQERVLSAFSLRCHAACLRALLLRALEHLLDHQPPLLRLVPQLDHLGRVEQHLDILRGAGCGPEEKPDTGPDRKDMSESAASHMDRKGNEGRRGNNNKAIKREMKCCVCLSHEGLGRQVRNAGESRCAARRWALNRTFR